MTIATLVVAVIIVNGRMLACDLSERVGTLGSVEYKTHHTPCIADDVWNEGPLVTINESVTYFDGYSYVDVFSENIYACGGVRYDAKLFSSGTKPLEDMVVCVTRAGIVPGSCSKYDLMATPHFAFLFTAVVFLLLFSIARRELRSVPRTFILMECLVVSSAVILLVGIGVAISGVEETTAYVSETASPVEVPLPCRYAGVWERSGRVQIMVHLIVARDGQNYHMEKMIEKCMDADTYLDPIAVEGKEMPLCHVDDELEPYLVGTCEQNGYGVHRRYPYRMAAFYGFVAILLQVGARIAFLILREDQVPKASPVSNEMLPSKGWRKGEYAGEVGEYEGDVGE